MKGIFDYNINSRSIQPMKWSIWIRINILTLITMVMNLLKVHDSIGGPREYSKWETYNSC